MQLIYCESFEWLNIESYAAVVQIVANALIFKRLSCMLYAVCHTTTGLGSTQYTAAEERHVI